MASVSTRATPLTASPADGVWWPVALSEAVTPAKPLGVVCAGQAIALFRNAAGAVCAVADACPHRRVPLSLGKMIGGDLRCAYHGWTFEGATGACTAIPNLGADEAVPASYRVETYPVAEKDGFVCVQLNPGARGRPLLVEPEAPGAAQITGSGCVSLGFEDYRAAMVDGPQALLALEGVGLTNVLLGDPRVQGGALVVDRGASWTPPGKAPPRFLPDYPLILRTETALAGGVTRVRLLDMAETPLAEIVVSASPRARGATNLCWRGSLHPAMAERAPLRWRLARRFGRKAPFSIFTTLGGAAIAALAAGPSRDLAHAIDETLTAA
jgi:nitrite reductase/ring-hydroxylating ferredoxin subunit